MAAKPQLKIIAVGKLRETFWQNAQAEYVKRLGGYASRLEIIEVADEPTPDSTGEAGATKAQTEVVLKCEAERILSRIGEREYVVALALDGKTPDSFAFSVHLEIAAAEGGASAFTYIVGGSLGLHSSVRARADYLLSLGNLTFPHQLARIMLLEQLYRAAKIARGESYHK